ncbi:heterokaryon incompatibility protein-domain-containing protein [Aspergillus tamarii]|uniref:Heterokaryon incompatibility protein-domain-containing protein n=1 Tax=Aspergillus tamarii TaxID=41984 RepID=A0A5N6US13_ASPTM|nr:heterokaryon incompatibility protein-domain-containing protein [Aspergillus tamarii]
MWQRVFGHSHIGGSLGMSRYTYRPLAKGSTKIRLLRLLPNEDKAARVECELIEYTLTDSSGQHPYEALSYVWGRGDEPQSILIGGRAFHVTRNLHAVLLRLRNHRVARLLWIDAICINQKDDQEKSHQIQLMRTIYGEAWRVIVWLGDEADQSSETLEAIRKAAEDASVDLLPQAYSHERPDREKYLSSSLALVQRPWFQRIWVLQEVALARDIIVMCGPVEINGYAFVSGLQSLEVLRTAHPKLQGLVQSAYHLIKDAVFRPSYRFDTRGTQSIGELIDMYHTRHASCLHDKVYALLGMCSDDPNTKALRPDYELPWNKVFERVIKHIISPDISVQTWPDREAAVIRGKGYVLGLIKSVATPGSRYDRQEVKVLFRDTVEALYQYMTSGVQWLLQTPAEPIRPGDIVCLLQGASTPTIVRILKSGLRIIMSSVVPRLKPIHDMRGRVPQGLPSEASVLHDLVLQWDWAPTLDGLQEQNRATVPREPHNSKPSIVKSHHEDGLHNPTVLHDILTIAVPSKYNVLTSDVCGIGGAPDGASVMKALLDQAGDILPITEDIVRRAANHHDLSADLLKILLEHRGNTLPITEQVVKAVAANPDAHFVMKLLFRQRGDSLPITEEVVRVAAGNTGYGGILETLFKERGDTLVVTENIVTAAAGNQLEGASIIQYLFEKKGESLPITEAVLIAAATNPGPDAPSSILDIILENRGERLPITEGVIKAVAANSSRIRASILLQLLRQKGDDQQDRALDLSTMQRLFQDLTEIV